MLSAWEHRWYMNPVGERRRATKRGDLERKGNFYPQKEGTAGTALAKRPRHGEEIGEGPMMLPV